MKGFVQIKRRVRYLTEDLSVCQAEGAEVLACTLQVI